MPAFTAGLPADEVHEHLQVSLRELARAEKSAVLWFAEILKRRLYRELGYSSIQLYANEALGFSQSKTYQFLRLADSLEKLPALRESVAAGELPWTKARSVARVATPDTERRWVAEAKRTSRRELEVKIEHARAQTRELRRRDPAQASMKLSVAPGGEKRGAVDCLPAEGEPVPVEAEPVPATLSFRLDPVQLARYEALIERLRKQGNRGTREELLLEALDVLASTSESVREREGQAANGDCTRVQSQSPYQIIVHKCADCGKAELHTGRGREPLTANTLARIECDARVLKPGERNHATIPPARRWAVLARDGHRCRVKGCHSTRFLEVHHILPRARGGGNDAKNLVTLCSRCHQLWHERGTAGLEGIVEVEREP